MITAQFHDANGIRQVTSDTWQEEIAGRGYSAFIFDCDGTLVESADVHFTAFFNAARAQGRRLDRSWYLARTGLDRISLFEEFAQLHPGFDISTASERSIAEFIAISDRVRPIAAVETLVRRLAEAHPLAVGTNAERPVAEASLRATGLIACFDHIVSVSDGLKPKPAPDIFSQAADLLGSRERTLVIEDAPQGVQAAKSAGLDVLQIVSLG